MSTGLVLIWTDVLVWLLVAGAGTWLVLALRREYWRVAAREVAERQELKEAARVESVRYTVLGVRYDHPADKVG